jgi:MYXO-CTERM domain-containing protein
MSKPAATLSHALSTCALAGIVTLAGIAAPSSAQACGGFFCNNGTFVAVEQTKERILFEVDGDGTLTVNVEISYSGSPEGFAWVVPVPQSFTGELGVLPPSTLRLLDAATTPRIIPPQQFGWDEQDLFSGADGSDADDAGAPPNDEVEVTELPQVGPYAPQLVSSDDAAALATWLNDNGYLITEEMFPFVAQYVASGMNFLAMKLAPDAEVQDIAPIAISYTSDQPMIPLVLTAVAAEPEMGILVFVAGSQRYEPANYEALTIDTDLLQADPRTGETNYYPLLSYLADQFDREAFFTEYSDNSAALSNLVWSTWLESEDQEEAQAYLTDLEQRHAWISRLYTRMNNVDIVNDPIFMAVGTTAVSNIYDLSGHDPVHWDMTVDPGLPCNDTYCGDGGVCATTASGVDGCVCGGGFSARRILAPNLSALGSQPTVTCQDNSFDMLASAISNFSMDMCADYSCGDAGSCVVVGGFPACQCPVGTAAIADSFGTIDCAPAIDTFGPDQLLWPNWPASAHPEEDPPDLIAGCSGCSTADQASPRLGLLSLFLVAGLFGRRRK